MRTYTIHLPATLMLAVFLLVGIPPGAIAETNDEEFVPTRFGVGVVAGNAYDPENDIRFVQLTGFALFDYDAVWPHRAPEALRFKVECGLGGSVEPECRLMASLGFMALYYIRALAGDVFSPYIEGGIGGIYTDFRVEGQGSRINFNPQAGIGADINVDGGPPLFACVRAFHVSNAGLDHDNRGINAATLIIGCYF
jgi:hypothetical protein